MITPEIVVEQILAHLNQRLTEAELVVWAEDALVRVTESEEDSPNEEDILDILTYLAAGDTPGFPLSWAVLTDFLARFGVQVRVVTTAA